MPQIMQDEAGNLWEVDGLDPQGNPINPRPAGQSGAQRGGQIVSMSDPAKAAAEARAQAEAARRAQEFAERNTPKPPAGFRFTQNGNLEPIPGGPEDPKNKGRSGEEAGRDEQRLGNLRALERQIAEVRRL
jgi:hypothetical protein